MVSGLQAFKGARTGGAAVLHVPAPPPHLRSVQTLGRDNGGILRYKVGCAQGEMG